MVDKIKEAAERLGIEKKYLERLEHPERVIEVTFPVVRDDGSVEFLTGWRSQYNSALGPYKGGIRFHQDVNKEEVVLLSKLMTFKNSLAGLPYGGGKGGVSFNPKEYSKNELKRVSEGFVRGIAAYIGPDKDIPAPDVNTNPQTMVWMVDEYNRLTGGKHYATFTGKPIEYNGLRGRGESTSRGAFFIMENAFKDHGVNAKEFSFAIQGFGNVGMNLARILHEEGHKVVAVSDSKGGIYNPNGLDIPAIMKHKAQRKPVSEFEGGQKISNEELLELEVDVLVPAALDNVINKNNVDKIKAKYIFEAANNPVDEYADNALYERGVHVYPDILVNAGGVSGSYLEWVQNREGYIYSYEEVVQKLKVIMDRAYEMVNAEVKKDKMSYREAAYVASVRRIYNAMKYQF